uniref:Uncharacterized protein n=1 Tax=Clastoptera arizonana TaxID=38151 RepID=A0A1B6DVE2_9HEMI
MSKRKFQHPILDRSIGDCGVFTNDVKTKSCRKTLKISSEGKQNCTSLSQPETLFKQFGQQISEKNEDASATFSSSLDEITCHKQPAAETEWKFGRTSWQPPIRNLLKNKIVEEFNFENDEVSFLNTVKKVEIKNKYNKGKQFNTQNNDNLQDVGNCNLNDVINFNMNQNEHSYEINNEGLDDEANTKMKSLKFKLKCTDFYDGDSKQNKTEDIVDTVEEIKEPFDEMFINTSIDEKTEIYQLEQVKVDKNDCFLVKNTNTEEYNNDCENIDYFHNEKREESDNDEQDVINYEIHNKETEESDIEGVDNLETLQFEKDYYEEVPFNDINEVQKDNNEWIKEDITTFKEDNDDSENVYNYRNIHNKEDHDYASSYNNFNNTDIVIVDDNCSQDNVVDTIEEGAYQNESNSVADKDFNQKNIRKTVTNYNEEDNFNESQNEIDFVALDNIENYEEVINNRSNLTVENYDEDINNTHTAKVEENDEQRLNNIYVFSSKDNIEKNFTSEKEIGNSILFQKQTINEYICNNRGRNKMTNNVMLEDYVTIPTCDSNTNDDKEFNDCDVSHSQLLQIEKEFIEKYEPKTIVSNGNEEYNDSDLTFSNSQLMQIEKDYFEKIKPKSFADDSNDCNFGLTNTQLEQAEKDFIREQKSLANGNREVNVNLNNFHFLQKETDVFRKSEQTSTVDKFTQTFCISDIHSSIEKVPQMIGSVKNMNNDFDKIKQCVQELKRINNVLLKARAKILEHRQIHYTGASVIKQ